MRKSKFTLFITVLIVLLSQSAYPIELKTAFQTGSYPRFFIEEREGKPFITGICADIMKAFERKAPDIGFSYDIRLTPFARLTHQLKNNNVQAVFGIAKNPEREKIYQYASTPLYPMKYVIFALADDKQAQQIKTFEDIQKHGGIVLGLRGTNAIKVFREQTEHLNIPIEVATSIEQNLKKMLHGRGSFFTYNNIDATGTIKKLGYQKRFITLPIITKESYHWLAFSEEVPKDIVQKAGSVLRNLEQNGKLQEIYEKYMKLAEQ